MVFLGFSTVTKRLALYDVCLILNSIVELSGPVLDDCVPTYRRG